jgi:hypothetical protein
VGEMANCGWSETRQQHSKQKENEINTTIRGELVKLWLE